MKAHVKKKWLEALTSGKYRKAKDSLKHHGRFCCLGVLCNLYNPAGWDELSPPASYTPVKTYQGADTIPPEEVLDWAALPDVSVIALMTLNDENAGWEKVIGYIKNQL